MTKNLFQCNPITAYLIEKFNQLFAQHHLLSKPHINHISYVLINAFALFLNTLTLLTDDTITSIFSAFTLILWNSKYLLNHSTSSLLAPSIIANTSSFNTFLCTSGLCKTTHLLFQQSWKFLTQFSIDTLLHGWKFALLLLSIT